MSFESVDDRLSSLPEEIVSHILSSMPTKFAVRTSILSKRWRCSWMFVTNLDFEYIHPINTMVQATRLTDFVDQVLKFCKASQVKLFRIHFPSLWVHKSRISIWISEAFRLNVRELDINVCVFELPLSMFTCKTLTVLRLGRWACGLSNWECYLPCLKTLDICVFANPILNAFKLIKGCPVLENLSLKVTFYGHEEDFIFNIPTLKRLKLTYIKFGFVLKTAVLNVPNLEYLFLGGVLSSTFVMEDVSSLLEASLSIPDKSFRLTSFELLKGISRVKSLSIQYVTSRFDLKIPFTLPSFPVVKQLELEGLWHSRVILRFLESCPVLKHLCIAKLAGSTWIAPELVPACMLTNLTTIKFSRCNKQKCDIEFLKYMLGNARVLKTVTITWDYLCIEEQMRLCAQLLKVPRASRYCEIHFLGNYSPPSES